MIVRNATKEDKPAVMKLVAELVSYFQSLHKQKPRPFEASDLKGEKFIVADEDGKLVGLVGYRISPGKNWTFAKNYYFVDDFIVRKEWRGKGVGSKLWEKLRDKARREGMDAIAVGTTTENTETLEYYKRLGLKEYYVAFYEML